MPGHVHLDLMRAGVIEDPFRRLAERSCAWVDEADWVYEARFAVDEPPEHAYLVFHGLDTIAEIRLNGAELGRTDNMLIAHEFQVGAKSNLHRNDRAVACIQPGENSLEITFRSVLRIGRDREQAWKDAGHDTLEPHWFVWGPRAFVRKAQYMYGWDWGPALVSCGIWRPVELVTVPLARIADWRYDVVFPGEDRAIVHVTAEIERAPGREETDILFVAGLTPESTGDGSRNQDLECRPVEVPKGAGRVTARTDLHIARPALWQPNGVEGVLPGGPRLYALGLGLYHGEATLDEAFARIGLRTVELVREADADGNGESFMFRVNGRELFAKGANWIPADSFPSRLTGATDGPGGETEDCADRVKEQIRAAADAGLNMLRVWGGGLYESDHFYEICDEYGILVWQDFPYACSYYPDRDEYAEAARSEAIAAVRRLRNHPCLALWCGNNENQMLWHDHWEQWGGREGVAPRFLGSCIYDEVLPRVVREEDPGRPYWPGSPFGGVDPNSSDRGDRHNWDVWHGGGEWRRYLEDDPRFVSEFGFSSAPSLRAWRSCLAESDRSPNSPAVRWHDKTRKGYETYLGYVARHFPEPTTLEDLVYYTQINQAEALKLGVEHWRRRKGRCWGTLFWQLNDCWPVQSWSVIDYELDRKASYYAAKRFYAPVLLSLVLNGDVVEAHLTNDRLEHIQGDVVLSIESFDGDVLQDSTSEAYVDSNSTARVGGLSISPVGVHARDVYVYARFESYWEIGQGPVENWMFMAEPNDLRLPDPGLAVEVVFEGNAAFLSLSARRFAPYVWWRLEAGDAFAGTQNGSDNFFHLRAGHTKRIALTADARRQSIDKIRALLRVRSL